MEFEASPFSSDVFKKGRADVSKQLVRNAFFILRVCDRLEGSFFLFFFLFFFLCVFKKGQSCEQLTCKKAAPRESEVKRNRRLEFVTISSHV